LKDQVKGSIKGPCSAAHCKIQQVVIYKNAYPKTCLSVGMMLKIQHRWCVETVPTL